MKKNLKIIILIFAIVLIGVLVYFKNAQAPAGITPSATTKDSILGCYVAHLQKDIYTLVIQSENNGIITGALAYNNYQKDSSSGSFNGTLADNILLGNYSFDSEGMHSDRQVIFKKVGNSFIQGFGPVKIVDNKEIFDSVKITYDPKSTFIKSDNCIEHFTDANSIFSFDYNPFFQNIWGFEIPTTDWSLNSKQKGIILANVIIPRTYMPNTNFSDARLTIGRSTDENAIKNCLEKTSGYYIETGTSAINGYSFKKFTFSDAGAGNLYDSVSYKGIFDGDCYAIEYTIHSTNIGNYPPEQGIKEFDKSKIQNAAEKIIESFKFLINSN